MATFYPAIQTEPGKLNCPNCETPTDDPVLTYSSQAKFFFIEFSPELMDLIDLCENMHVGSSEYKLRGWCVVIMDILPAQFLLKGTGATLMIFV